MSKNKKLDKVPGYKSLKRIWDNKKDEEVWGSRKKTQKNKDVKPSDLSFIEPFIRCWDNEKDDKVWNKY